MGFATITDPALFTVLLTTAALLVTSLACLASALLLRFRRLRRENRLKTLEATWRILCHRAMVDDLPDTLPSLPARDAPLFAQIWLDFLNRVRGSHVQQGLKHLARRIQLDHRMLSRMRSRRTDDQLLVLMVLGRLQDSRVLPMAERCLKDDYSLLSLSAAHALMQIDPRGYTHKVLAEMARQPWPLSRIRELLALAPPQWLQTEIHHVLREAQPAHAQQILRVLADLGSSDIEDACSVLLSRFPDHADVLASVLTHTSHPGRHDLALKSLDHPAEMVRLAACRALSRIGSAGDRATLLARWPTETRPMMHAIAITLMALPRMNAQQAQDILDTLHDTPVLSLIWLQAMLAQGWGEDLSFQHWMATADA